MINQFLIKNMNKFSKIGLIIFIVLLTLLCLFVGILVYRVALGPGAHEIWIRTTIMRPEQNEITGSAKVQNSVWSGLPPVIAEKYIVDYHDGISISIAQMNSPLELKFEAYPIQGFSYTSAAIDFDISHTQIVLLGSDRKILSQESGELVWSFGFNNQKTEFFQVRSIFNGQTIFDKKLTLHWLDETEFAHKKNEIKFR